MQELFSLHKYFVHAHQMFRDFEKQLQIFHESDDEGVKQLAQTKGGLYMSLWYGMLYTTIEGWQELNIKNEEINKLLQSTNLGLLKRYRNGIFHFQKNYFDDRFQDFYKETSTVNWIRGLHSEFDKFFLEKIRKGELNS